MYQGKLAMISSWFSLPSIRTENTPNPEVPMAMRTIILDDLLGYDLTSKT
jgi:hypothetical protein